nr:reverse transcriptase domain-containing protein [Tanacetum cinerariifolium]
MIEINIKGMETQINNVKNKLRNEMKTLIQASMSNQTNELKNMMASFFQMNTASTSGLVPLPSNTIDNPKGKLKAITTRSGLVLDGPFIPMPPPFINLEEDERVEETLTDPELSEYTTKKMLKALLSNKEKLLELENTPLNENCSAVILKKLPEKLRDPGKFLIIEIEYLLNLDPTKEIDSIVKDLVDEDNLADPKNNLVDTSSKMFIDEHTLDYSSPLLYNDFDDDIFKLEFDDDNAHNDPFDFNEDKIKESKLLIDELDPPRSITVQVTPDNNLEKISNASLILEDFNPPLYELPFQKEVLGSETLLSFSSENEEKVFNTGILTSKGIHTSLLLELSNRGPKAFKVIKIFKSLMEIFPCSYGEDIRIWMFHVSIFIPHEQFGGWVKLSDLKQALRGWQPMLILI